MKPMKGSSSPKPHTIQGQKPLHLIHKADVNIVRQEGINPLATMLENPTLTGAILCVTSMTYY